jgi:hypothetical protein
MTSAVPADAVSFIAASGGTADFVQSVTRPSFYSLSQAATAGTVQNNQVVPYLAQDDAYTPTQREWGLGTVNTGTNTIVRTTVQGGISSGVVSGVGVKVNFAKAPLVSITPLSTNVVAGTIIPNTSTVVVGGTAASSSLTLQSTSGTGTSDSIVFQTGSQVEAMRIDTVGRLIIADGGTASLATGGQNQQLQNYGTDLATGGITFGMFNATAANSAHIDFYRSKAASIGSATVVASGDTLGEIYFWGAQQTGTFATQNAAAKISVFVDGTVTSGAAADMPGRISFWTTPDGSGTLAEAMRISADGSVTINGTNTSGGFPWVAQCTFISASSSASVQGYSSGTGGNMVFMTKNYNNDTFGDMIQCHYFRGTSGSPAAVVSGDILGVITCFGATSAVSGGQEKQASKIIFGVDGTPTANTSCPGRIEFHTASSGNPVERMRLDQNGAFYLIGVSTTASAANAFINNASSPANSVLRSTSSARYKTDITPVPQSRIDALMKLEPIEYKSLATSDNPEARFVGLTAEAVAAVDPYLVSFDEHGRPDGVMYDRVLLLQVAALRREIVALKKALKRKN